MGKKFVNGVRKKGEEAELVKQLVKVARKRGRPGWRATS